MRHDQILMNCFQLPINNWKIYFCGSEPINWLLAKEKLNAYMQIDEIFTRYKKYKLTEDVSELFLIIAKDVVKQGKFNLKEQDTKLKAQLIDVIDVFCEKEILFFDPQTGIITPNSRIYLKAMEDLKKDEG